MLPFGPGLDPSKIDPKTQMQMMKLIQTLPPAKLQKLQSLMHNAMAGFDVRKEVEAFERDLPTDFREKIASMMMQAQGTPPASPVEASPQGAEAPRTVAEARLTLLKAVAAGEVSPDEAYKVLFPDKH
jgi:hypothetical protein